MRPNWKPPSEVTADEPVLIELTNDDIVLGVYAEFKTNTISEMVWCRDNGDFIPDESVKSWHSIP